MFIRIGTTLIPTERIAQTNTNANINGRPGVEVWLHGIPESFQFTGEFASEAYDQLQEANLIDPINLGDQPFCIADIEWVELSATLNATTGVEVRLVTDPPGVTRKYTGGLASQAYDLITAATGTED